MASKILSAYLLPAALHVQHISATTPSSFLRQGGIGVGNEGAGIQCTDLSNLEGCTCEGHQIGKGLVGDFAHNARSLGDFSSFFDPGKSKSFWDFTAFQDGKEVRLNQVHCKAALVVNVASAWGLTNAFYQSAKKLLNTYGDKGLKLIALPSNQFGNQAPHSGFCEEEFFKAKLGVRGGDDNSHWKSSIVFLDRMDANGPNRAPFYSFLMHNKPEREGPAWKNPVADGDLAWNYEKFLVDHDGRDAGHFSNLFDVANLDKTIGDMLH